MVGLLIAFPGLVRHDALPVPAVYKQPRRAARRAPAAISGFSLSPYPPAIPGAPPPITTGPGAPTLDMSVPPRIVK